MLFLQILATTTAASTTEAAATTAKTTIIATKAATTTTATLKAKKTATTTVKELTLPAVRCAFSADPIGVVLRHVGKCRPTCSRRHLARGQLGRTIGQRSTAKSETPSNSGSRT